jgi:hypothetical protein
MHRARVARVWNLTRFLVFAQMPALNHLGSKVKF